MKRLFIALPVTVAALAFSAHANSQVTVSEAWARATPEPQTPQTATGAYMQLLSKQDARLVQVRSPIAQEAEIHETKMENGIMKMRPLAYLDLPGGKPIALKPAGFHIMLTGLKQPIKEGGMMPLVLVVEDSQGKQQSIELEVPVRSLRSLHSMPGTPAPAH